MSKEQSEKLTIPVTPRELDEIDARARAAGETLALYCRGQLGLTPSPVETAAGIDSDEAADELAAVLGKESIDQDPIVTRLKQAPGTDAAELDRALAIVRDAVAAERAFALEARVAISAMEQDEE